jgi:hypothetical protein
MSTIVVNFWRKLDMDVQVNLFTVPPVTADNAAIPVFGRWFCTSPYIGKGMFGVYYVKRLLDRVCTTEEYWAGTCEIPRNPYAFFFDTTDETEARFERPFMFWDSFVLNLGLSDAGAPRGGRLLVWDFVPGSGSEFWWKQTG